MPLLRWHPPDKKPASGKRNQTAALSQCHADSRRLILRSDAFVNGGSFVVLARLHPSSEKSSETVSKLVSSELQYGNPNQEDHRILSLLACSQGLTVEFDHSGQRRSSAACPLTGTSHLHFTSRI